MKKILIDLLLVLLTAGVIWAIVEFKSCSEKTSSIYTAPPADTVYTKGKPDTTISVKKYHHTIRKKKTPEPAAVDTVVTESYTAIISLAEVSDTLIAGFEVLVKERQVFRVDTVSVVQRIECEYWVAGAIVVVLVLLAVQ